VTHLDSHMGVLAAHWYNTGSPSKLDVGSVYKKLAQEFALPVRMASQELLATRGAGGLARGVRQGRHRIPGLPMAR
jgi:hypothetical protein